MTHLCDTGDLYHRFHPKLCEDFLKLAKEEAGDEVGARTKSDEEDYELWAHIDSEQSSNQERGLFAMWLATLAEAEEDTRTGQHWVLGNIVSLDIMDGESWAYPWMAKKWENEGICFNHYNDLCDEMEMADEMDAFSEEMEQHRLCRLMGVSEWTIPLSCRIERVGQTFWVGRATNGSGMIYIPRDIIPYNIYELGGGGRWGPGGIPGGYLKDISLLVEASFKGFEACRGKVFMPWRANYISRE